jgi:hypothetical protein
MPCLLKVSQGLFPQPLPIGAQVTNLPHILKLTHYPAP